MNNLGNLIFQRKSIKRNNYLFELVPIILCCLMLAILLFVTIIDPDRLKYIFIVALIVVMTLLIDHGRRFLSRFEIYENGISAPYLFKNKKSFLWGSLTYYTKSNHGGKRLDYIDVRTKTGQKISFYQYADDPIDALKILEDQLTKHGINHSK